MAQYKVPQDVQREDKIIGPFSLRQFLFLVGGAMGGYIAYQLFSVMGGFQVGFMVGVLIFLGISAFAVIEIQGMKLTEYLAAIIVFALKPRKRVWQRDITLPDIAVIKTPEEKGKEKPNQQEEKGNIKSRLDQLAYILDTRGWGGLTQEEGKGQQAPTQEAVENEPISTPPPQTAEEAVQNIQQAPVAMPAQGVEHPPKIIKEEVPQEPPAPKPIPVVAPKPTTPETIAPAQPEVVQNTTEQTPTPAPVPQVTTPTPQPVPETVPKPNTQEAIIPNQKEREKNIQKELDKVENLMMEKVKARAQVDIRNQNIEQKKALKELKDTVSNLEKETKSPEPIKKKRRVKLRMAPIVSSVSSMPDFSQVITDQPTTPKIPTSNVNITVDEKQLDDILQKAEQNSKLEREAKELKEAFRKSAEAKKVHRIIKSGD